MDIRFHNPVFLWFLLALIPLALFYIYLIRRESSVVPSLQIWRSTKSAEVELLNRPLKRFLEWLFATCFVLSVTFGAAGVHTASSAATEHLILLVDNSSSMTRTDDESSASTLLSRSINRVNQVLRHVPDDTRWRVYQLAPSPRLTDRGTGPVSEKRLGQLSAAPLEASGTRLKRFLNSVMNVTPSNRNVQSYLYSDRQLPDLAGMLQRHSELQLVPAGGPAGNVAITDASLERGWNGQPRALHLDIQNYSDSSNTFPVRLYGLTQQNRQTTLSAGESTHIRIPVEGEPDPPERLGAVMDTADPFSTDNGAYFLRRTQPPIPVRIDLPSPSSRFVRTAIASAGSPFKLKSGSNRSNPSTNGRNRDPIQLLERSPDVPPEPGTISFLSSSTGENLQPPEKPISGSGSTLTRGLDFQELTVESFSSLKPDTDETCLLASGDQCLAVLGPSDGNRSYARFGFSLSDSNFILLPEFPVLIRRIMNTLHDGRNQNRSETGSFGSNERLDQSALTRTYLRPDGGLARQRINGSSQTNLFLPPGWYRTSNRNENRTFTPVNFFHPDESRMNRTSPIIEQRISSSSPPIQTASEDPLPVRTFVLLIALVTWAGFLILSIY